MSRVDAETRLSGSARDARPELRLWLRLLTCTTLIEREIRRRLADRFDTTLPRFDLMAQLDKAPDGMTLGEISLRMMVTNGNVTGLVDRLAATGHVERRKAEHDRRAQRIVLTEYGRAEFRAMAREHAVWIADLLGDLSPKERDDLMALLARAKISASRASAPGARHAAE
jgi:DNA-binding MarR family transcriptional regulator